MKDVRVEERLNQSADRRVDPPQVWGTSTPDGSPAAVHSERSALRLSLLGYFTLSHGEVSLPLPRGSARLLALLAIRQRGSQRAAVAGTLWPESDERHAHASLRSALARLRGVGCPLVEVRPQGLQLTEGVGVDIAEARALALRVIASDGRDSDLAAVSIDALSHDLLPEWYDDWVILESEDWRQLRLHALEALCAGFIGRGRFPDAVAAAISAIKGDPLRESARLALVRAHLAEHNRSEALREFENYRRLLRERLSLEPSSEFVRLMETINP